MPEHLSWKRQPCAHQHGRPEHRVESGNVLSDDVEICRPPCRELGVVSSVARCGRVVDERIEPDVNNVVWREWQRDSPELTGAADGDVLEACLEESQHLIATNVGLQELRMILEVPENRVAISGQPEKEVLFFDPLRRQRRVEGALPINEILFLLERLAGDAVPALVHTLVDVANVEAGLSQPADRRTMARFGRANEVVERDVELFPDGAEFPLHHVAVRQWIEPLLHRFLVDVLRVLVIAHHEVRLETGETFVAGDDIRRDLFVRRAQMGTAVHVVDCRGEKEAHDSTREIR
jgi:hypothetical protein